MFNNRFPRPSRIVLAATASAVAMAVGVLTAAPAGAEVNRDHADGICDVGEFCLYYNSSAYGYGSVSDSIYTDVWLGDNSFLGKGAGNGQIVNNNAAAYWNRTTGTVHVYTREQYQGTEGWIGPNLGKRNFSAGYKNNVESYIMYR